MRLVACIQEVGERRGVTGRARIRRDAEGRQGLEGDDPGGERRGEVLGEERPQGLVFPRLDVAGRPVVEEGDPEELLGGLADGNGGT